MSQFNKNACQQHWCVRRKLARARPQLVVVEGQVSAIVVAHSDDVAKKIANEFLHLSARAHCVLG